MRLVSLRLWNLRSYEDAAVEFGDGVNLFEGDIGSGKSTILLAIEFALFGLAEVASKSLLRHGEKEGGVELVFQVKDRTVRASRKLRRTSAGAQVKDCSIEVDGKETRLSSNEMRQRVLGLLEYGERRNPRARLDIFTYSTYTPQEDMRTVLSADTKMHNQRKETLRRALDIEEYSQAVTGLDAVRLQLDRDADVLVGMARDIDELREELVTARDELEAERANARAASKDLRSAERLSKEATERLGLLKRGEARYREAHNAVKDGEAALAKAEGELKEVTARLEASLRSADELDDIRGKLEGHSESIKELAGLEEASSRMDMLRGDLHKATVDLEKARVDLEKAQYALRTADELAASLDGSADPQQAISDMRRAMDDLRAERGGLDQRVQGLKADIALIETEERDLLSLEGEARCPRCRQPLTEVHLESLLADNRRRRADINSRIRETASISNRLSEELDIRSVELVELETMAEGRRRTLQDLERARSEADRIEELTQRMEGHPAISIERELKELEGGLDKDRLRDLRQLSGAVKELREAERRLVRTLQDHPALEEGHRLSLEALEGARASVENAREEMAKASEAWDPDEMDEARKAHEEALRSEEGMRTRVSHLEDLVDRLEASVDALWGKVSQREGVQVLRELHVHVSSWLADRVIPAVRAMERSVMALMADEMDVAASNWFNQLVEDPDLVLSIDEDFVPMVTHQDFEMDLGALSGGERTAAAFAYRLALNGLVRSHATPGQRNLLMLDEPTDGFSREQVVRMGGVLRELDADQVVIVSHDRELRAFANHVFVVHKAGGASHVSLAG